MQSPPSFTGRSRRRTTRPWVKASDRIARLVITLGGISTIAAPSKAQLSPPRDLHSLCLASALQPS